MTEKIFNIGVDVGGTNIKIGIVDNEGAIISKTKIKTPVNEGSGKILLSIVENIELILKNSGVAISLIKSVGIGFPGTTDFRNGIVVYAPNLFWKDVEVVKMFRMYYNIPVYIGQDSRAAAWAEFQAGAGVGFNHVACLTLGTGIGCGLILDQKIHHGGFLSAGEFGHQIVEENGRICNCGRHGCLEAYAGGLAIVKDALMIPDIASLVIKPVGELTVLDVFNLADQGNAEAMRIVESVVRYLGIGMVNLINLVSPEIICVSGGISNAPDRLLFDPLIEFIQLRAYPPVAAKVKVVKSTLGDDAPLIGASMLHLSQ